MESTASPALTYTDKLLDTMLLTRELAKSYELLGRYYVSTIKSGAKSTGLMRYWSEMLPAFFTTEVILVAHRELAESYIRSITELDAQLRYHKPDPALPPALQLELDESYDFFEYVEWLGPIFEPQYLEVADRAQTLVDIS